MSQTQTISRHALYLDHPGPRSIPEAHASCCREFWLAPFRLRSYALIFSNIFVHLPFMFFTWFWVANFFAFSVGFLMFFPFGPLIMMFSILSWRWLGKLELRLHRYAGYGSRAYSRTALCYGGDVCVTSQVHDFCSWNGFWGTLKDLMLNWDSWRPVGYFLFVKPFVASFIGFVTLVFMSVSLAFIFNFVVLLSCSSCYKDSWDWNGAWLVNSYKGSGVTIPLGLLLLFTICYWAPRMAEWAASLALRLLGKRVPPGGDDTTPINQIQRQPETSNTPANAPTQNSLFVYSTQSQA